MKITFTQTPNAAVRTFLVEEPAVLPAEAEALDKQSGGLLSLALSNARFTGKAGQQVSVLLPEGAGLSQVLLLGTGQAEGRGARDWETIGARLYKAQASSGMAELDVLIEEAEAAARLALGMKLAAYRFDTYRTKMKPDQLPSLETVNLVSASPQGAEAAYTPLDAASEGTYMARDLVNMPPNDLNPETYAEKLKTLASSGLEIEILGETELAALGMNAMLGVGQGSRKESKLGILKWMGGSADSDPVVLVGKGVCFDTGGISLKPGAGMQDMRGDMGGSAAVVGTLLSLARRNARANVVGLVGLVENMPDGDAIRPGDILTSASGQTIEIQNTDAEGRLVLCDVLWYAQKHYKPAAIVDLATLTGAIVIGLGHHHAGLFSNDDQLAEQLTAAGQKEGERAWRLPLGAEYDALLKSQFADMRNIGGRAAGSITAAQFLQRFIEKGTKWAHLDIAGVAWVEGEKHETDPSWASGFGPRLLDRWIADHYES